MPNQRTGASVTSIGFEAARVIAKYAALVILAGRNQSKCAYSLVLSTTTALTRLSRNDEGKARILAENPSAQVRTLVLDLASFASIRKAAAEVIAYQEPIHVSIHHLSRRF